MNHRNVYRLSAAERNLDTARGEHGSASVEARSAAVDYSAALGERIVGQVTGDAVSAQDRWDREGTPLWMRLKMALRPGHRRG